MDACSNFEQHKFKKDLCVNCMKPRSQHAGPVPARRPVRKPEAPPPSQPGTKESQRKTSAKPEKSAKPKPNIATKPSPGVPKQNSKEDLKSKNSSENGKGAKGIRRGGAVVRGSTPPKVTSKPVVCDIDVEGESDSEQSSSCVLSSKTGSSGSLNDVANVEEEENGDYKTPTSSREVSVERDVPKTDRTSGSHYYHKYDLSLKGRSGKPKPINGQVRSHSGLSADQLRAIQQTKKQQQDGDFEHVAIPYTVVHVSNIPHNVSPDSPDPPKLPSTAAPRTESGSPIPAKRVSPARGLDGSRRLGGPTPISPKPNLKKDASESGHDTSNENKHQPMQLILCDGKLTQSPSTPRKPAVKSPIIDHAYELVECNYDSDDESKMKLSFHVDPNDNQCEDKSSGFTVLSNIDIQNKNSGINKSTENVVDNTKKKSAFSKDDNKRKSTGKSFFRKFFSFGSGKDSSDEVESDKDTEVIDADSVKKMSGETEKGNTTTDSDQVDEVISSPQTDHSPDFASLSAELSELVARHTTFDELHSKLCATKKASTEDLPEQSASHGSQKNSPQTTLTRSKQSRIDPMIRSVDAIPQSKSVVSDANKRASLDSAEMPAFARQTSRESMQRRAIRPPSVPPPAVPLGRKDSVKEDSNKSRYVPASPKPDLSHVLVKTSSSDSVVSARSDYSDTKTEHSTGSPTSSLTKHHSPKPVSSMQETKSPVPENRRLVGKIEISGPVLEQTSVNLERSPSNVQRSALLSRLDSPGGAGSSSLETCNDDDSGVITEPVDQAVLAAGQGLGDVEGAGATAMWGKGVDVGSSGDGSVSSIRSTGSSSSSGIGSEERRRTARHCRRTTSRARSKSSIDRPSVDPPAPPVQPPLSGQVVRRKMAVPPPPPPAGGPGSTTPTAASRANSRRSMSVVETNHTTFSVADSSLTLPKPMKRNSPGRSTMGSMNSSDIKLPTRAPSRSFRRKTLSEGIKVEPEVVDINIKTVDLSPLDTPPSRFLQRALPSPPPQEVDNVEEEDEDIDNLYETVSPDKEDLLDDGHSTPYEDIEDEMPKPKTALLPSSLTHPSTPSGSGDSSDIMSTSSEYLEPVALESPEAKPTVTFSPPLSVRDSGSPKRTNRKGIVFDADKGNSKLYVRDWRPRLAPRDSVKSCRPSAGTGGTESYVMLYANREIMEDRDKPALTITEGYAKMASLHQETLHEFMKNIYSEFIPEHGKVREDVRWVTFSLEDGVKKAYLVHSGLAYHRATCPVFEPTDCMLMLSVQSIPLSSVEISHVNVLSPVGIFSDRVPSRHFAKFENMDAIKQDKVCGMVSTNVAILSYSTVMSLEDYLQEIDVMLTTNPEDYDWCTAYILAQIINGLIYLHGYEIKMDTLTVKDILVATSRGYNEKFVLLNPYCVHLNKRTNTRHIGKDLIRLLFKCLHIIPLGLATDAEVSSQIPIRSIYSRGFIKLVQVLHDNSPDMLTTSRNLLEFMLWGPSEDEITSLSLAEDREQAFGVWLNLEQCRVVTRYALEVVEPHLKEANQIRFLGSMTGSTLFEITKFLHK